VEYGSSNWPIKEVGQEVNTEKTKYMFKFLHQYAGQNHSMKTANRCFENMAKFRYLGTAVTNQNFMKKLIAD
jgi:hypothetical protein